MKKKKSSGGGANWMDTYGDMVTLLLCFFVLLYSMSTISEEAWKNLVMSFNPLADQTVRDVIEGGDGPSADGDDQGVAPVQDDVTQDQIDAEIEDLFIAIQAYISSEGLSSSVQASKSEDGRLFISFAGTAFFDGFSWELRKDALPVLDGMCEMLSQSADAIDEVRIQGHTADDPNSPSTPRSDRFLASNRATNVLVYIQEHTDPEVLDPAKLVSEGVGQWHPVEPNDTSAGRAANRRVTMIVSGRDLESEMGSSLEHYTTT